VARQPLPKVLNQKSAKRLLMEHGWTPRAGGRHALLMEKEGHAPVALSHHGGKDYGAGLRRLVLKQAGLLDGEGE
jgi:predicted RNA binding protein YcfA (HicA-like mRNA interferase family)